MRILKFLLLAVVLVAATAAIVVSLSKQQERAVSLMIAGGLVVTMDGTDRVIPNGAVVVDADKIVEVGAADQLEQKYRPAQKIDARSQIIMPGLINNQWCCSAGWRTISP